MEKTFDRKDKYTGNKQQLLEVKQSHRPRKASSNEIYICQYSQNNTTTNNNKVTRIENMNRIRSSFNLTLPTSKLSNYRSSMSPRTEHKTNQSSKEKVSSQIQKQQIHDFHQSYDVEGVIGEGANGYVKLCRCKANGKQYAVKIMTLDEEQAVVLRVNFRNTRILNHPNIIHYRLLHLNRKKDTCHLVMEYFNGKNLRQLAIKDEKVLKIIFHQVFKALQYMHKKHIVHRDIKPDNIMYNEQNKIVKIVDFGTSCKLRSKKQKKQLITNTGTFNYKAPEMITGGGYDNRIDIWSAGVTLYELITGYTPFQSDYISDTINNIDKCEPNFDDQIWNKYSKFAKDLVVRIIKKKQQRLNIQQALNHLWFNHSQVNQTNQIQLKSLRIRKTQQQNEFKTTLCQTGIKKDTKRANKVQIPNIQFLQSDEEIIDDQQ